MFVRRFFNVMFPDARDTTFYPLIGFTDSYDINDYMEDNKGIINPDPYFSNKYINVSISPKQGYGFPAYINGLEIVDANAIIDSKTHSLVSGAEYRYDTGVDILDQIILY